MTRAILTILLAAGVTIGNAGCAFDQQVIYRTAEVPKPPKIERPVCDPIDKTLPVSEKLRLLAECEAKRDAYARELEEALKAYK